MVPVTATAARVFLGIQLQCVQCHDHPFLGEFGQHHLYGMNGFFRQVEVNSKKVGTELLNEIGDNPKLNTRPLIRYGRTNGVLLLVEPFFLNGKRIPKGFAGTRREMLAKYVTEDRYFGKAYVNRMWAHFFGRGMCREPAPDDFHDENPVVHPELLDRLAEDFVKSGHDPRAVMRWICNSDAYSLTSVANKTNDASEQAVAFSRLLTRPLSDEQMVESVLTVAQFPDDAAQREKRRQKWLKELYRAPRTSFHCEIGRRNRDDEVPDIRAMWFINGGSLDDALASDKGIVATIFKKHPKISDMAVREIFLTTLSRPPSKKEIDELAHPREFQRQPALRTNPQFHRNYYADLVWALLNSAEFGLNH
jgi:hypothetical protein